MLVYGDLFSGYLSFSLAHCVSQDFQVERGIAKSFKSRFGQQTQLISQSVKVGWCAYLTFEKRFIFYLVTKVKYDDKPTYKSIRQSLESMLVLCKQFNVNKLAMLKIGYRRTSQLPAYLKSLVIYNC